ncbi:MULTISPECIES: DUF2599 domain-containing protein [unclassified Streptomyces]|uniref:DUF2599 domain-containing protein n=1 Tax=unclassified Streptomyces TaxID=2593676 RepID=UPI0023662D0B|nr:MULTISPECIES: DUF2599 domain-containing protein [unclassified Streptomyces]MDF3148269.1 DUF2599 domain-containing protein [Streptomyces sp. T21Q-yed]WDF38126.1 DUF2599 domain-containing protein [Streptomyces sp. T12]
MRRRILRLLVAFCATIGLLALPAAGLTSTAYAATSADTIRDEDANLLANARFNSGLHYFHKEWRPGPGVNSFQVIDRCEDGLTPYVTYAVAGRVVVAKLSDECNAVFGSLGYHTLNIRNDTSELKEMSWYVSLRDENGDIKYAGSAYLDDWLGTYSYDPDSALFPHSSVYVEDIEGTSQKTVTASLVWTKEAATDGSTEMADRIWDELLERTPLPADLTDDQRDSMYKQLWCHVRYAIGGEIRGEGGPTWDLEAERPNIPWDEITDISEAMEHKCNWGPGQGHGYIPPTDNGDTPEDLAPIVDAGPDVSGDEGSKIKLAGEAWDDAGQPGTTWSYEPVEGVDDGATCAFDDASSPRTTVTCTDDGTYRVTLTADDGVNRPVSDSAVVTVKNVAPVLKLEGPRDWDVYRVEDTVRINASFTDPGANDTHTCEVVWDDGTTSTFAAEDNTCTVTHAFGHAGMNTLKVTVTDDDRASDDARTMVVVYDPRAGALTGLGTVEGSAFTVVGKYPAADSTVPAGTAVLEVPAAQGRLTVASTKLEWLVITPDGKAAVKGESAGHGFLGYAESGKFRSVVWPLTSGDIPPDEPLYDTSPGASWDLDEAEPKTMSTGATVIDSGWIPGLPQLPGSGSILDGLLPGIGVDLDI